MALYDVDITRPESRALQQRADRGGAGAVRAHVRARQRAAGRAHPVERQLDRARRRRRRDAAVAARLRAGRRSRRALGRDRRRSRLLRRHQAAAQPAARPRRRRRRRSARSSATSTRPAARATRRNWPSACTPATWSCSTIRRRPAWCRACCETGARVIWRAHIGLDLPNDLAREAWDFLTPYVQPADAYVFSRDAYRWPGLDAAKVTVIAPVDRRLRAQEPRDVLHRRDGRVARRRPRRRPPPRQPRGVRAARRQRRARRAPRHDDRGGGRWRLDAPLLAQVSRWDRLKDPLGVLAGFAEYVETDEEPHLVLAGPDVSAVTDDPEGAEVLAEVEAAWQALPRRDPAAGAPRAAADGRHRRERDHGQRAAAARRRGRADEPGGGLRPHGRRGDVEGTSGRRHARGRHPGPDRSTGGPGTWSSRTTCPPSARA